jgi:HPt (histidine-containing phosphotransfer) domain-containing protein
MRATLPAGRGSGRGSGREAQRMQHDVSRDQRQGVAGVGRRGAELSAKKLFAGNDRHDGRPSSEAIDLDYLRRFTLGNVSLEEEVLRLFSDQAPLYLEQLRNAKSAKAWAEAAHTIKGSGAAIGARRLSSIAEMVERLDVETAGAQDEDFRAQAIEAVTGALEEVRRCIDRLLERK